MNRKQIQPDSMSLFIENDVWLESIPNPCILPVDIMVKAHSSRKITVHWAVKTLDVRQSSADQLPLGLHVVVEDTDHQKTIADVYTYQYTVAQYTVPANLEPGHRYRIQVTVRTFGDEPIDIAFGSVAHTSVLTEWELLSLLSRAIFYLQQEGNVMKHIKYMYRNKPFPYFEHIITKRGGIMEVYSKDLNGDPGCPINTQIDGLFFNVWVDPKTSQLPKTSPFGECRLVIPAEKLLTEDHNLYFADFYCHSSMHYITLVAAKQGSEVDVFCQKSVISLPFQNKENPFLFYNAEKEKFYTSTKVRVEVLYTENVDILKELRSDPYCFSGVTPTFAGSSKFLGKPKNETCEICNLYLKGIPNLMDL